MIKIKQGFKNITTKGFKIPVLTYFMPSYIYDGFKNQAVGWIITRMDMDKNGVEIDFNYEEE